MSNLVNRRKFLKNSFLGAVAGTTLPAGAFFPAIKKSPSRSLHIFSKHLQWLDYQQMAQTAAALGFDGVDLTVRPNGHVLPENVEKDLPKAAEAIQKAGISLDMITTKIKTADDPLTEKILKTAAGQGVKLYRMDWYRYNPKISIAKNLEQFKTDLLKLSALNEKYQLRGAYQNHAGTWWFGASIWDLGQLLDEINAPWLGCQYDIRHAMVEGGQSWVQDLKFISNHINSLDIKDFIWEKHSDQWKLSNVPLGEGMVDFNQYMQMLKQMNVRDVPYSIHYEYPMGGAEHGDRELHLPAQKVIQMMEKDLKFLKHLLAS